MLALLFIAFGYSSIGQVFTDSLTVRGLYLNPMDTSTSSVEYLRSILQVGESWHLNTYLLYGDLVEDEKLIGGLSRHNPTMIEVSSSVNGIANSGKHADKISGTQLEREWWTEPESGWKTHRIVRQGSNAAHRSDLTFEIFIGWFETGFKGYLQKRAVTRYADRIALHLYYAYPAMDYIEDRLKTISAQRHEPIDVILVFSVESEYMGELLQKESPDDWYQKLKTEFEAGLASGKYAAADFENIRIVGWYVFSMSDYLIQIKG